jgi:ABC-type amino acid transport substrate-binding protein
MGVHSQAVVCARPDSAVVELTPFAHRVQLISGLIAALAVLTILIISPGIDRNALTTLEKIRKRGYLNVLTLNSATTYYQDIDGPNGLEYHLASGFAESIGVKPHFVTVSGFAEVYPELLFGSGDIAAAGLSENESSFSRSVAYGPGYFEVRNQVLYHKLHVERPKTVADLAGGSLKVISGTAQVMLLHELLRGTDRAGRRRQGRLHSRRFARNRVTAALFPGAARRLRNRRSAAITMGLQPQWRR